MAPRYVSHLAPSAFEKELYPGRPALGRSAYTVCLCTRMTNAVNSGMKISPRVRASFSRSHPNALATITAAIPSAGIAGDCAASPFDPPSTSLAASLAPTPSGSSSALHSLTITSLAATHPMRISTSAAKGENRIEFQNSQLGCDRGDIVPSMKNHPFVSYEYASLVSTDTAVRIHIARLSPLLRQLAIAGSANGRHTVAKVSADKNHVGAFHSSACAGNHACDSVVVSSPCHAAAIGPLYVTSANKNTGANAHCARRYSG